MKRLILSICLAFLLLLPVSVFAARVNSNPTRSGSSPIDGATIGATTPSTGAFTTLSATKTFTQRQGTDVASAGAMTLGDGNVFDITGVTTINTIVTKGVGTIVVLEFDGILQLTHSNDLFLPTAANITTAAGDIATFYEYATGDWRCMVYMRADGTALVGSGAADDTAYNATSWDNNTDAATKNAIRDKIETMGGSGTLTTIKENDAGVGGADIVTLDFLGADFDLAETPDTEIQVIISAAIARVADIDDSPVDAETTAPISSNWAYDHVTDANQHPEYMTPAEFTTAIGSDNDTQAEINAKFDARALESVVGTSIGNGLRLDGAVMKADREFLALSFDNAETQTAFSEANMLLYGTINNQGADEETDIITVAVSYPIKFEVEVSEDHIIELCPPSGEIFTLNGTALAANDCVDSSAVVGDCFMVKRRQIAAGTWQYFIYTIQGAHLDTGAGDD